MCVMRPSLQTTIVCCGDSSTRNGSTAAARLSATCLATRVARCERLLKETRPARALQSFHSRSQRPGCPSPTRLVSQRSGAPGRCGQPADCMRSAYRTRLTARSQRSPLQLNAHQTIGRKRAQQAWRASSSSSRRSVQAFPASPPVFGAGVPNGQPWAKLASACG